MAWHTKKQKRSFKICVAFDLMFEHIMSLQLPPGDPWWMLPKFSDIGPALQPSGPASSSVEFQLRTAAHLNFLEKQCNDHP